MKLKCVLWLIIGFLIVSAASAATINSFYAKANDDFETKEVLNNQSSQAESIQKLKTDNKQAHNTESNSVFKAESLPITVTDFNIDRYMGNWYEIARLPTYFSNRCLAPIIANYTHLSDKIQVINTCATVSGDKQTNKSIIYISDENLKGAGKFIATSMPSWLRWTHLGRSDYWLLYTDYHYAVVGTPDRKYLWIYSRQENPPLKDIQNLVILAQKQGYRVTGLIFNYPSYYVPDN